MCMLNESNSQFSIYKLGKFYCDHSILLKLINDFNPVVKRNSSKLRARYQSGGYIVVAGKKFPEKIYQEVIADNNINMASHISYYGRPWAESSKDHRFIKSKFGEKWVEYRNFRKRVTSDNVEATLFFWKKEDDKINQINHLVSIGNLQEAIKIKNTD